MSTRPLTDATLAATWLLPQIVGECVLAEHGKDDRTTTQRRLRRAIELTGQLRTRIEAAELLYAATPAEEQP